MFLFQQISNLVIISINSIDQMISEEYIRSAAGEEENKKVYEVDLNNKAMTKIMGLKPFLNLRCLQLNFNRIRCIENLESLTDLRELHLEYNELTRIEGLQKNKLLTTLCLNANKIQKIQNINHLVALKTLAVDENRIDKISGLQTLKELRHLSLSKNNLTSIDSLPAFSKVPCKSIQLEYLNVTHNKISKIQDKVFSASRKLTQLSVDHNKLTDLSFVNSLANLERLSAQNNLLQAVNVRILPRLEYLNISNNRIERLPKVVETFPELSTFLFANNQIMSQYVILESLSEAEMVAEIDYRGNPMENPNFQSNLYRIYGFDFINGKKCNDIGTRYVNLAKGIAKYLNQGDLKDIEDDKEMRDIKMSGFSNEQLERQMTGMKPNRPNSPRKKAIMNINYEDIDRSYKDILENNKKIDNLRSQCQNIFKNNGIEIKLPIFETEQEGEEMIENQASQSNAFPTQIKMNESSPGTTAISQLESKNEENKNKWKQLKNKEKNFNIRGVVRRMSGSNRKGQLKEGSASKIPNINGERSDLMRTQLNPPRWNNDTNLMKTIQSRPFSAKKNVNK